MKRQRMKRERGHFRGNCLAAKQRLGGDFWVKAKNGLDNSMERAKIRGGNGGEIINRFINQYKNSVQRQFESSDEDEMFYRNISDFLRDGRDGNPLSRVLDREYMATLGDAERERYVFNLSAKVQQCIERFHNEKEFAV